MISISFGFQKFEMKNSGLNVSIFMLKSMYIVYISQKKIFIIR